jgi:hypothetical protein
VRDQQREVQGIGLLDERFLVGADKIIGERPPAPLDGDIFAGNDGPQPTDSADFEFRANDPEYCAGAREVFSRAASRTRTFTK